MESYQQVLAETIKELFEVRQKLKWLESESLTLKANLLKKDDELRVLRTNHSVQKHQLAAAHKKIQTLEIESSLLKKQTIKKDVDYKIKIQALIYAHKNELEILREHPSVAQQPAEQQPSTRGFREWIEQREQLRSNRP